MRTSIVLFVLAFALLVRAPAALAETGPPTDVAALLVRPDGPCSALTDVELERIGDEVMERLHPGEAHEMMDTMMGGEGSQSLRAMHIAMGRQFACGSEGATFPVGAMMGGWMMGSRVGAWAMPMAFMGWGSGGVTHARLLIIAIWAFLILGIACFVKRLIGPRALR